MDHRRVRRRPAATSREIPHRHPAPAGAFLAQVAHESDHFRTTTSTPAARPTSRRDLGNTQRGDGKRFRGHGLIQLTGRANHAAASEALRHDFVADPEDAAIFPWAAEIAGWYWSTHELNRHADADDVHAATKAINGGLNGLASRIAYLDRAKRTLA